MTEFCATLPIPPTTNNLFATVMVGGKVPRRVKSRTYRAWSAEAVPLLVQARQKAKARDGARFPLTGELALSLVVRRPRRGSDLSNRMKAIEDALTEAGVWGDDAQVADVHAWWARDEAGDILAGKQATVRVRPYRARRAQAALGLAAS